MLELTTPTDEPGRLHVYVIEPGGSLWLMRNEQKPVRFSILLVVADQRRRLAELMARSDVDRPLRLHRTSRTGTAQQVTLEQADRIRLVKALLDLERFEADPNLPEWHERGYRTKAEAEAIAAEHPEWFPEVASE